MCSKPNTSSSCHLLWLPQSGQHPPALWGRHAFEPASPLTAPSHLPPAPQTCLCAVTRDKQFPVWSESSQSYKQLQVKRQLPLPCAQTLPAPEANSTNGSAGQDNKEGSCLSLTPTHFGGNCVVLASVWTLELGDFSCLTSPSILCSWGSYLAPSSLSFPIYQTEITIPISPGCLGIKQENIIST